MLYCGMIHCFGWSEEELPSQTAQPSCRTGCSERTLSQCRSCLSHVGVHDACMCFCPFNIHTTCHRSAHDCHKHVEQWPAKSASVLQHFLNCSARHREHFLEIKNDSTCQLFAVLILFFFPHKAWLRGSSCNGQYQIALQHL